VYCTPCTSSAISCPCLSSLKPPNNGRSRSNRFARSTCQSFLARPAVTASGATCYGLRATIDHQMGAFRKLRFLLSWLKLFRLAGFSLGWQVFVFRSVDLEKKEVDCNDCDQHHHGQRVRSKDERWLQTWMGIFHRRVVAYDGIQHGTSGRVRRYSLPFLQ